MALFRVKARWTGFSGAPGYNVFHFDAATEGAGPDAQACVDALRTFYTALVGRLPSAVRIDIEGTVEIIEESTGTLTSFVQVTPGASIVGTATGGFSSATGACINWITDGVRNGRRLRGRSFIVPLGGTSYDSDGTLGGPTLTALQDAANALAESPVDLQVYGRPSSAGAADGYAEGVTSTRVADKTAILRSRRD